MYVSYWTQYQIPNVKGLGSWIGDKKYDIIINRN